MELKKLLDNKNDKKIALIGTIIIVLIIIALFTFFHKKVNQQINKIEYNYLIDITESINKNLTCEFKNSLNYLEGLSELLENYDSLFSKETSISLNQIAKFSKFDKILLSNSNGIILTSDNEVLDISDRDYFKEGLKGHSGITNVIHSKLSNKKEILIYSPIYKSEKIIGVLVGSYMINNYTEELNKSYLKGDGFIEIFHDNGDLITNSNHQNIFLKNYDNIGNFYKSVHFLNGYNYDSFADYIDNNSNGIIKYELDNKSRTAYHLSMKINDWNLIYILPSEIIEEYVKSIDIYMSLMLSVLFSFFIMLLIFILIHDSRIRKKIFTISEHMKINNERFIIAIHQAGNIVIEYDIKHNYLYHFGKPAEDYGFKEFEGISIDNLLDFGIIAPEYQGKFKKALEKLRNGANKATIILKTVKVDKSICWVKLTFTNIFDSDNNAIKAIGTLQDITHHKEIEQLYFEEGQQRKIFTSDSIESYKFNILNNASIYSDNEIDLGSDFCSVKEYEDFIYNKILQNVYKEDLGKLSKILSFPNLSKEYTNSNNKIIVEFCRINNNKLQWLKATINLITNIENDSLIIYLYLKDITDRKEKELSIKFEAEHDQLTKIYNRHMTEKLITDCLNDSQETLHAFMSIDLDGFKGVNDNHGHMVGDELLIEMSLALKKAIRKNDIFGRMGGDEFVIFLKDINSIENINNKAQILCDTFKKLEIVSKKNLKVSGSIGISIFPNNGTTFSELYNKSDIALYEAKLAGKDQFKIYSEKSY